MGIRDRWRQHIALIRSSRLLRWTITGIDAVIAIAGILAGQYLAAGWTLLIGIPLNHLFVTPSLARSAPGLFFKTLSGSVPISGTLSMQTIPAIRFEYRGFKTFIRPRPEIAEYTGTIEGTEPPVEFSASSILGVEAAFHRAVEEHIQTSVPSSELRQ
ncbi:MAG: hypothetical protein M3O61_08940 [Gemmatimonadota bacterium]|nr:hypothetical protein [Gemmatimonadota bacterium]